MSHQSLHLIFNFQNFQKLPKHNKKNAIFTKFHVSSKPTRRKRLSSRPNTLHSTGNPAMQNANMAVSTGILPLTIKVGTPLKTYRLNKIKTPRPDVDFVYFHLEKFSRGDTLWYPQWLKLSIFSELTRESLIEIIESSMQITERTHFMITMARILTFPDKSPRVEGNPFSTQFHWKCPVSQHMWSWVQHGESPFDRPFRFLNSLIVGRRSTRLNSLGL